MVSQGIIHEIPHVSNQGLTRRVHTHILLSNKGDQMLVFPMPICLYFEIKDAEHILFQ